MYRYETHLHTSPVSRCARAAVRQQLEYYKGLGYDGVFITNHFVDVGSKAVDTETYDRLLEYFFSDYENGIRIGEEIGIKVFCGIELSYMGSDFLVYGLDEKWFKEHPEIQEMKIREKLTFFAENGALIIHAHPFREAGYIDHIRLFPRNVHGVEVINACRTDHENKMARIYADEYKLLLFAGSDNHISEGLPMLAGIESEIPINTVQDFVDAVLNGEAVPFYLFTGK